MGTLKYINLLPHIDINLQRVKYIIKEQSMNINVFLLFLSFVFLQIERERERGYIKLGIRRNGLKVYSSFFLWWSSSGEYFLFCGLIDFMLFLILAWRTWLLCVRDIFLSSSTRSTCLLVPFTTNPVQQLTFLLSISSDGKESPLPF